MSSNKFHSLPLLATLALGFAGVWHLQHQIDRDHAAMYVEQDDLLVRSGSLVKALSLEYAPLIADLYWTRVVQYYGYKHHAKAPRFDLLWPLLDVTTALDPHLIIAFRFGSTFLTEPPPRGAGRPDLGIQLIERGIRENPEYWRLYEDLGFIYYFNLQDYQKASQAFLDGSKVPGALVWMKILAAKVAEEGNTRETSVFLWNELYNSATDKEVKENALTHLHLLRAEADCDRLDALANEYQHRSGHRPTDMRELVKAGLLPRVLVDPMGFPYVFGEDGGADLNPDSPLFDDRLIYQRKF
jgi:hypothetical protein